MLKDPAAVLDYSINWATWLGDDTIATSTWTVPDGITKQSDTHDDGAATIWLSGGELRKTYRISNQITTTAGRTDERTLTISVRDR